MLAGEYGQFRWEQELITKWEKIYGTRPSSAECTNLHDARKLALWQCLGWDIINMYEVVDDLSTDSKTKETTIQLKQNIQIPKKRRKFGHACSMKAYRSHNVDMKGRPYQNKSGKPYYGSICDICEESGHSYYHHPLRCHRQHPGWREYNGAPEQNGTTSWHVRGGEIGALNGATINTISQNK